MEKDSDFGVLIGELSLSAGKASVGCYQVTLSRSLGVTCEKSSVNIDDILSVESKELGKTDCTVRNEHFHCIHNNPFQDNRAYFLLSYYRALNWLKGRAMTHSTLSKESRSGLEERELLIYGKMIVVES